MRSQDVGLFLTLGPQELPGWGLRLCPCSATLAKHLSLSGLLPLSLWSCSRLPPPPAGQ